MSENCGNCRFWSGSETYLCRCRPPVFDPMFQGGRWPATTSKDWCGEHREPEWEDAPKFKARKA